MTLIAALWLGLLGLLSAAPLPTTGVGTVGYERRVLVAPAVAEFGVSGEAVPEGVVRTARIQVGHSSVRPNARAPFVAPLSAVVARLWSADETTRVGQRRRTLGAFSHAVASRGGVSPHFSTAPPLRS